MRTSLSRSDPALPQDSRPQDRAVVTCGACKGTGYLPLAWAPYAPVGDLRCHACAETGLIPADSYVGPVDIERPEPPERIHHYCPQGCVSSCPED